ncbi:ABC transporter family protein [Moesziomyces antarcticus]|uniref:ABC transporter family protein n=2 Tax=Pseudozyma antarctica TaxID=84753 RepID=A0A081CLU2_PSEA2|nr:ABC transporter family protein [Moesziomyces antarcticus]GAK67638.1 ABC transporter family protein [Moesziomyces antarcticus]
MATVDEKQAIRSQPDPTSQDPEQAQTPPLTVEPWEPRAWWKRVPFLSTRVRPIISALDPQHPNAKMTPEATANWFSLCCFAWIDPILTAGYTRPMEKNDLYLLPPDRCSDRLGAQLLTALDERQKQRRAAISDDSKKEDKPAKIPSLMWAMNDIVFRYFWIGGFLKLLADIGTITSPLLLRALINFGRDSYKLRNDQGQAPPIGQGVGLAIGLFLVQALCVFLNVHAFNRGFGTGIILRGALIQAIFQRGMNLSTRARTTGGLGVSKLVTLISADATRIDYAGQFFHMAWTSAVQIVICIALLLWSLKYSALPGIAVLVLMSPVQTVITKRLFVLRKKSMVWTDKRNKAVNEVVGGIRVVKQFAWEQPYSDRVAELRKKEMAFHRVRLYLRSLNLALAFATPTIATVLSFVTYALVGNELDAAILFSSLSFFTLLRTPLQFLPIAWNAVVDAKNAADRIEKVFDAEIQHDQIVRDPAAEDAIKLQDASFTWETTPFAATTETVATLDALDLTVPRGALCAVVGGVGSGKSSLVSALAGEMRQTQGKVTLASSTAVCAQTAWIQSTTIRNNIVFGNVFDPERYRYVLDKCCLLPDLATLAEGDQTIVGEKGVSLSGGQKQRLNIARALYHNSEIVLLDDCLSALDARVGADIFANVIAGPALQGKTRLLVTHSLNVLRSCDWLVYMENGRIAEQGTYDELVGSKSRVAELVLKHTKDQNDQSKDEVGESSEGDPDARAGSILGSHPEDNLARLRKDGGASSISSTVTMEDDRKPDLSSDRSDKEVEKKTENEVKSKALMQDEERSSGSVSRATYLSYLNAAPLSVLLPLFVLAVLVFQGSTIMSPVWLMWWQRGTFGLQQGVCMGVYAIFGITQSLGLLSMGIIFSTFTIKSATTLHHRALQRVLHAPFSFFDTTPQGRITHRFSKDMDTLDNIIGEAMRTLIGTVVQVVGSIVLIAILTPYFLIPVAVILVLYFWIAAYYRSTARELRRIDAGLRSSMHEHFSESLHGLVTIRAFGQVDAFVAENCRRIDNQNRAYWLAQTCQRWLSTRLDFLGSLLILSVAILVVASRFDISPGESGVALSYILTAQSIFGWMIRHAAELENNMSAVERVLHYANHIEQEKPYHVPQVDQALAAREWPERGEIRFDQVEARYTMSGHNVLDRLDLHIKAGEKIAFCGRTGAGKSTLVTTLLRTLELSGGSITVDGIDIATMGLHRLRSSISLIPQDAVIYSGTLRYNLDPLGECDDATLHDALQRTSLTDLALDMTITEEGGNLSAGQRSLISLARAMVRKTRIVILDEATANIDQQTDMQIQEVLKTEFDSITTLTVAHRIRTILHSDRVCVLDKGHIVEIGPPAELWRREKGPFRALCDSANVHFKDGQWH